MVNLLDMPKGIDVSYWQSEIKYNEMERFPEFMFTRALFGAAYHWYGDDYDKQFDRNWLLSKEYGIPRGAYHFLLSYQNPKLQAQLFVGRMEKHNDFGELPPVCDVEAWKSKYYPDRVSYPSLDNIQKFCNEVMRLTGLKKMIIYGGAHLKSLRNIKDASWLLQHDLWLAHYTDYEKIEMCPPWDDWTFWQCSAHGDGSPYGVRGNIDLDYFNGTQAQLDEYLSGEVVVEPTPPEEQVYVVRRFLHGRGTPEYGSRENHRLILHPNVEVERISNEVVHSRGVNYMQVKLKPQHFNEYQVVWVSMNEKYIKEKK